MGRSQAVLHGWRTHIWLAFSLGLALVARLIAIAARPIWYDEAFSLLFAPHGPASIVTATLASVQGGAAEEHPPLYYLALWDWMKLFGEGIVAGRLCSVVFGLGTVGLLYLLVSQACDRRAGLAAAFLAALSPFLVHYSQEIRMYAMLAFLCVAAAYSMWKALEGGRLRWWLLFSLTAALAQYTHNLAVIFLLPLALTPLLWRRWAAIKPTLLASVGAVLLYMPWSFHLLAQLAKVTRGYWTEAPSPARLLTTLLSFVVNLPLPDGWLAAGLFVTLFSLALAAWATLKALRRREPVTSQALWLAYLAFCPAILLYLVAQILPVYVERALLASGVVFWGWMGWALTREAWAPSLRMLTLFILLGGLILGLVQHVTYAGFPYAPYSELMANLEARASSPASIVHSNKLTALPGRVYAPGLAQTFIADPPGSGADTLAQSVQAVLGVREVESIEAATAGAERLHLVIFRRAIEEYQASGQATHPQLAWLQARWVFERMETWGELRVYTYRHP